MQQKWMKSRTETNWIAVKKFRNYYSLKLKQAKTEFYTEKLLTCKGNTKKLYNSVNGLINREKYNPLPPNKSNKDLSEHLSNFFFNKIKQISDSLKQHNDFVPPTCN
jgi:hypothetical protein